MSTIGDQAHDLLVSSVEIMAEMENTDDGCEELVASDLAPLVEKYGVAKLLGVLQSSAEDAAEAHHSLAPDPSLRLQLFVNAIKIAKDSFSY